MKGAVAVVVVALTAIHCSTVSERLLLDQFFSASRLRDRTALARFATVVFEPHTDGIVLDFVVLAVTPARQVEAFTPSDRPAALAAERQRVITLSLADPIDPVDWRQSQTLFLEKVVTVAARIGLPDGSEATRSVALTLQQARVASGPARAGRWIVVRFVYRP
jgi:hypothetical protein